MPVIDQEIKAGPASLGLFVGPFVHTDFAVHVDFLTLLHEFREILSRFAPYLKVHKSGDLLLLALGVSVMLIVGDRGRHNGFAVRRESEFWLSGEVAGD